MVFAPLLVECECENTIKHPACVVQQMLSVI